MRWLRGHWPELLLVGLGIALRAAMAHKYEPELGYDFESHWKSVSWVRDHAWEIQPLLYSRTSYHPPLYYFLAGAALRAGATVQLLGALSALFGSARLALIWLGLERHLADQPMARRAALAIAAILPVSLHIDAMVNGEALLGLLAAAAMVLVPVAFTDGKRWRVVVPLGLVTACGLLTKVSMVMVIAAVGVVALVEAVARAGSVRERAARLAPLACAFALVVACSGWYFARNARLYGKPFVTAFDATEAWTVARTREIPYWKRRPIGFLLGWSTAIYRDPYWPSGAQPEARLFPMLIATTFSDYYRYGFAPQYAPRGQPRPTSHALSVLSVWGGTLIALLATVGWFGATIALWRRRAYGLLAVMLVPAWSILGQIDLTIRYPVDWIGLVKGAYSQFAAPPLCAAFGVAMEWLWRRRGLARAGFGAGAGALVLVFAYVFYARVWVFYLR